MFDRIGGYALVFGPRLLKALGAWSVEITEGRTVNHEEPDVRAEGL
jgi:hypothetical protein